MKSRVQRQPLPGFADARLMAVALEQKASPEASPRQEDKQEAKDEAGDEGSEGGEGNEGGEGKNPEGSG